ncbi:MAG: hypothetical protein ACXV2C_01170 [Candidatus Bathyarchaeia archaeon]
MDNVPCYLNAALNNFGLGKELRLSDDLKTESGQNREITKFYYRGLEWFTHGFVVFLASDGTAYLCHILGDGASDLYIQIRKSRWTPEQLHVYDLARPVPLKNLLEWVAEIQHKWGLYNLGTNDCRHFAQRIAQLLKKNGDCKNGPAISDSSLKAMSQKWTHKPMFQ